MTGPTLQIIAQTLTGRFLNTAVEGVVLALIVWAVLHFIGHHNSGTRFAIWFSTLAAVVALPFFAASSTLHSESILSPRKEIVISRSLALYIFTAWVAIVALSLLRLGYGLWRVRQIRKSCTEIDLASLDPAVARAIQDSASHRWVTLCVSDQITVPAAIGFLRPAIVFPAQLLPQLSPDELQIILLHELAHLRRWDDWTNLVQKIVKAIFFFHPAVWWIENRLTIEREMACDDAVVAQTSSPRAYASSLISFAEKLHSARTLALAQFLVSRMRQMSVRVAQILDPKRTPHRNSWKSAAAASAALLALAVGAGIYAPQFIAFENLNTAPQSTDFSSTAAASSALATQGALESALAQKARVIPATFNPRQQFPARPAKTFAERKPVATHSHALRTSVALPSPTEANLSQPDMESEMRLNERPPMHATYVILQTTQYDASGAGVWTLCIWRIEGGDSTARELQSAIVLTII